jgi:hypothetical protein
VGKELVAAILISGDRDEALFSEAKKITSMAKKLGVEPGEKVGVNFGNQDDNQYYSFSDIIIKLYEKIVLLEGGNSEN